MLYQISAIDIIIIPHGPIPNCDHIPSLCMCSLQYILGGDAIEH